MLFDFLVDELAHREPEDVRRVRPVRVALQNQRVDLLAFDGVLDAKLAEASRKLMSSPSPSRVKRVRAAHRIVRQSLYTNFTC